MAFPLIPLAVAAWSAGLSKIGQDDANEENAEQAQLNRDFQERMSNTAYQRAVSDMQKAGLNPGLAYQQGGASSPTGSSAAAMQNSLSGAAQATNLIPNTMLQKANIENVQADTAKKQAETQNLNTENYFQAPNLSERNEQAALATRQALQNLGISEITFKTAQKQLSILDQSSKAIVDKAIQDARQATIAGDRALIEITRATLERRLREYDIPQAKAMAQFFMGIGKYSPQANMLGGVLGSLSKLSPWGGLFGSAAGNSPYASGAMPGISRFGGQ